MESIAIIGQMTIQIPRMMYQQCLELIYSGRCLLKNCSNIQDNIFIFSDTESDNVHVFKWINDNIQSGSYLHKLTQSKKVNVMKMDCSVKMTKAGPVLYLNSSPK